MDNQEKQTNIDDIKIEESASNPFKQTETPTAEKNEETKEETAENKDNSAEFEVLKAEYDKLNSQYIRLAADFDNFRKRQTQEREQLLRYGTEEALKKMIAVLDNFDRAKKSLKDIEDCSKYEEAFELLSKQVKDELTKMGMEEIEAEGKPFDPNFHEAVMQTPSDEYPEETIIQELQKGYKLGEKVLRPTMVNVAVAK